MKKGNVWFVISLLVLGPVVVIFLMGGIGSLFGDDPTGMHVIFVGIVILCEVVIGCTLILGAMIRRLTQLLETKERD